MVELPAGSTGEVQLGRVGHKALIRAYREVAFTGGETVGTHTMWAGLQGLGSDENFRWPEHWTRDQIHYRAETAPGDDSVAPPTASVPGFEWEIEGALREARWRVLRAPRPSTHGLLSRLIGLGEPSSRPEWSNGVRTALATGLLQTYSLGLPVVNAVHLMLALMDDPENRAVGHLRRQGIDVPALQAQLLRDPGLHQRGALPDLDIIEATLAKERRRYSRQELSTRAAKRKGLRLVRQGPFAMALDLEQRRQAVRLGHPTIGAQHTLLAILSLDSYLHTVGRRLDSGYVSRNTGARLLREAGVRPAAVRSDVAHSHQQQELADPQTLVDRLESTSPEDPLLGATVAKAFARSHEVALELQHPDSGTTHLVYALVEDSTGETAQLLRRLHVDPIALRDQAEQELAELPAAW